MNIKLLFLFVITSLEAQKAKLKFKNIYRGNKKITFSIIGLPRSGTTITCSFFNSFENSFCLCEPYWLYFNSKYIFDEGIGTINNKVSDLLLESKEHFLLDIKKYLQKKEKFNFSGIKETYCDFREKSALFLLEDKPDINFFVIRNPFVLFNSWKKVKWGGLYNEVDIFVSNYKSLVKLSQKYNGINIFYENFSRNSAKYIEQKLDFLAHIVGDCKLEKMTGVVYGDPEAKQSTHVRPARMDTNLLTDEERDIIKKELWPLYKELLLEDAKNGVNYSFQ